MSRPARSSWWTSPSSDRRDVGIGDVGFALLVSAGGIAATSGLAHPNAAHVGVWAAIAVLLMTTPVVLARRHPAGIAATLAVGAVLNWVLIGHMVRCGATLPAAFYSAFALGSWARSRGWAEVGFVGVAANIAVQCVIDPQLGAGVIAFMLPICLAFLGAGFLLRRRNQNVAELRARTLELHAQRERNAELAVAADQARIAADLNDFLHARVDQMAAAAAVGRGTLAAEPDRARLAFIAIQESGREALSHMRSVVSTLRDTAPTEPQPVLAQLDRLLGQSGRDSARLIVSGDPRLLPPGLELSGYRIVEHLLLALDNDPGTPIDVAIAFGPELLELTVSGPRTRRSNLRAALAVASERAAVHGGSLRSEASAGRRTTVVQLPLAVAVAGTPS